MARITPFLWFDHQAEEAMNFYVSIFKNSKVLGINRYGDGAPREVDCFWEKLSAGGKQRQCARLEDKSCLPWQIVPNVLPNFSNDPDPNRAGRGMQAILKMRKFDIVALPGATDGERKGA